jgi:hypothetical protein
VRFDLRIITRTALLLALTLLLQSLRFVIPAPVFGSTLLIGSLVNACLLVSVESAGIWPGVIVAVATPIAASFQQMLPLPIFILPVAVANILYILIYKGGSAWGKWQGVTLAAMGKALFLYLAFAWLLTLVNLNVKMAAALLFVMGWPQLATGLAGGLLAMEVIKRLRLKR